MQLVLSSGEVVHSSPPVVLNYCRRLKLYTIYNKLNQAARSRTHIISTVGYYHHQHAGVFCLQEEKLVRKKLQAKYMVLETRKDGTKFTNRPLKESAERLQNLAGQYDDMQKQLVEQVLTSSPVVMSFECWGLHPSVHRPGIHVTAPADSLSTESDVKDPTQA